MQPNPFFAGSKKPALDLPLSRFARGRTDCSAQVSLERLTYEYVRLSSLTMCHKFTLTWFDSVCYVTLVKPGIAIVGVANGPHSYFGGVKSSVEFMACSQVTT